jgi:hypothetical protein
MRAKEGLSRQLGKSAPGVGSLSGAKYHFSPFSPRGIMAGSMFGKKPALANARVDADFSTRTCAILNLRNVKEN